MNEQSIAMDRDNIARRVADFRETQARFQRAREEYYDATIKKIRHFEWNGSFDGTLSK